jgi:hypothetical protein
VNLVRLANWRPGEIKLMSGRERTYWAEWYLAIEDQKVMNQITQ